MRLVNPVSHRRLMAGAASAAVVLLGVTACGSTSNQGSSGSSADQAAIAAAPAGTFAGKAATGSAIKIGIISPEDGPNISQPTGRQAAEAAIQYANENLGGIAGHKITFVVCKDQEDPASAAACAQQMIDAKVAAVVELNTAVGDAIVPPLVKAGIPYTSYQGASGSELTSPGSYVWTSGVVGVLAGEAKYAATHGVKSLTLFATDAGTVVATIKQMGTPIFGAAGITFNVVPVPLGTPDVTPQVSAGIKNKPGALSIIGDATMCGSTLKALNTLGSTIPTYVIAYCLEQGSVANAGAAALEGTTLFVTADGTGNDNEAKLFRAVMAKYAPGVALEGAATTGFQSMLGFIRATQSLVGEPTTANVNAALKSAKNIPLPLGDGITFTCNGASIPHLTAICSPSVLASKVSNAKPTTYEVIN